MFIIRRRERGGDEIIDGKVGVHYELNANTRASEKKPLKMHMDFHRVPDEAHDFIELIL